jgi:DNA repair exonuclease SbcCD ATPase subunit
MILFKTLRWKNFLSTGNIFTEISLNKSSSTLIVGENGAGKSTILDALTFSLFGKPFRKINKPQLLNSITQKGLVVEIEFDIGSNKYKIIRGLRPNIFEVYMNDNLLNQTAEMKDYQEILERQILKLNYKSFCQVVVLGSASFVPFMQLAGGQRREIIEDLLDLQIFTIMNSLLKDKISVNNENLAEISSDQKVVTEKLKIIQQHLLEKQNSNDKIIREKQDLLIETIVKIEDLQNKYFKIKVSIENEKEKVADSESITSKITKLEQLKHKIEAKKALICNDIEFFKKHENCPTCTQSISAEFRETTIESKNREIETIDVGLVDLAKKYDETSARLSEIMSTNTLINDMQIEGVRMSSNIDSLIRYKDHLNKEINTINKDLEDDEESKMTALQQELEDIATRYNDAMDEKQLLTAASYLLKDGGIKAKIIKQYVPVINKLINKYLSAMDFFVQFELDEEFNETIKSRFRDEFSYSSFSEGEKMRINLAILFTWRAVAKLRNSVSTNLLIMDEVMDSSMDSNGTDEFLKILNNLTSDTNTFIISHKGDQLYDKFPNIIRFEKKQNFSKVI